MRELCAGVIDQEEILANMIREYIAEPLARNATPAAKVWLIISVARFMVSYFIQLGANLPIEHTQPATALLGSSAGADLSVFCMQAATTFERCRGWLEGTLEAVVPE